MLFNLPEIQKAKLRRRTRSISHAGDEAITGRKERINKRNRLLVARYYYHTEIRRLRFDDVIKVLCDHEFFVEYRTIANALVDYDDYFKELLNAKTTAKTLRKIYPSFDWKM